MPATSKKQFRFMQAVKHGGIKKPGLSPSKAAEFVQGQNYSSLPTSAPAPAAEPDADDLPAPPRAARRKVNFPIPK